MISLVQLILEDPTRGLLALILIFCLHLWREQGKMKTEVKNVEKMLDKKKLDREDFDMYNNGHSKEHEGILAHLKTAIELLKGGNR
ncbi:MAG TPA: hypothetical protein DCR90_05750 [Fusobacteriaceae bacterium]|nr:hypothetical protein [Fusobacteriaceae bacterium]